MQKNLYILTGKIHSGKTTRLQILCTTLKKEKIKINGVLSRAFFISEKHSGYDGVNLKTEESFPLLRREGKPNWERIGPYFFIPEGLEKAKKAILDFKESDITVIDEIGPKELENKGFWPELSFVLGHFQKTLVVIRESLISEFTKKFKVTPFVFQMGYIDLLTESIIKFIGDKS
jgi:nucleoside-triphosphatase THEP1